MNKSGTASQVIAHPRGGGAIKGLGETFAPDLHTGTGNLSVPIALPMGRAGLKPDLTLAYSTGQGNGPFGLGWALSVPGVSRDTAKRVPVYDDEADVFLLSGAEQLVPLSSSVPGATRYRPRTEGLFARVTHLKTNQTDYWEVRSRNGLISLYGDARPLGADSSVVRHPDESRRIFSWHLTQTRDPFGNRIEYLYEREPSREDGPHSWDQIYLKTIRYGDYGPADAPQFMVTVDFVYEGRPDPFSTYKSGFEIRTNRRCTRIEITTHADAARLTRVYRLVYLDQVNSHAAPANGASLLQSIEVEGVDGDAREKLPPLEFGYTSFDPGQRRYQALTGISGALPDRSLAHPDFELADLFGRGLPDVVQIGDVTRYWRNLGNGMFDVPRPIERLPSGVRLGDAGVQLADVDGDGHIDLVMSAGRIHGYVPLTVSGKEATGRFVQYAAAPPFPLNDPEVRLLDLDGDGITDALRTGALFELYFHDRLLKKLAALFGGDPKVCDLPRVLRLPGSWHQKINSEGVRAAPPFKTVVKQVSGQSPDYSFTDFETALADVELPSADRKADRRTPEIKAKTPRDRVNEAALAMLQHWAEDAFPGGKWQATGAYRLSSEVVECCRHCQGPCNVGCGCFFREEPHIPFLGFLRVTRAR
jgi:hypothetical protein